MSVLSTRTKVRLGTKVAKQAAKHPELAMKGAKPIVKHKAKVATRKQERRLRDNGPRLAIGIAIGAVAMFLFDPTSGRGRRRSVLGLLGSGSGDQEADAGVQAGGPAHPAPGHMPPDENSQ
jgi:hypothetical protein